MISSTEEQKMMSLASWGMSPLTSSIVVESCPSPNTHCPGDDLLKSCSRKVEQRTEATSDLKNSPLFYAVLSEHRLIWRRLTTFGFIWQTLWWWSVPLCTTARVQTRWLAIILLALWLPRRERRKLPHWRIDFVQERKSGTIGSYFPNINEQCLSLH